MDIDKDSAQVQFPPPLMLLGFILLGTLLHWFFPVQMVDDSLRWIIGIPLIVIGLSVILYCAWNFRKAKTEIKPWKTTSTIITTGIYRFSRNPIYLSFIIAGLGVAFASNSLWTALAMIPLIAVINKFVIEKEERYLESKFGDSYLAYKAKVRRWL